MQITAATVKPPSLQNVPRPAPAPGTELLAERITIQRLYWRRDPRAENAGLPAVQYEEQPPPAPPLLAEHDHLSRRSTRYLKSPAAPGKAPPASGHKRWLSAYLGISENTLPGRRVDLRV